LRRIGAAVAAVAAVLLLTAGSTLAFIPGTLDQHQDDTSASGMYWYGNYTLAQTFTVGVTGTLNAVGVYVGNQVAPSVVKPNIDTPNATFNVVATTGGLPSGSGPIVSEAVVIDPTQGWVYWTLPTYIPMASGQQYAIVIQFADGYAFNWAGDCTDVYAGGVALVHTSGWQTVQAWQTTHPDNKNACLADYAFRTYVTAGAIPTATPFESFQGETAVPSSRTTPPPTSTARPSGEEGGTLPFFVIVAGFGAAAAFVTIRSYGIVRR
jgi:hypothetical protein